MSNEITDVVVVKEGEITVIEGSAAFIDSTKVINKDLSMLIEKTITLVKDNDKKFDELKVEAFSYANLSTKEELAAAKSVRQAIVKARTGLEKACEDISDPALNFRRNAMAYSKAKVDFIAPAENHIKDIITKFENEDRQRIEKEKQAKIARANRLKSIADSFVVVAMFDDTALSIGAKIDSLKSVNVVELELAEYEPVATANINASIHSLTSALEICKKREELAEAEAKAKAEAEAERRAAEARQKELDRIAAEELAKAKAEAEAAKAQLEELARQERIKRDEEAREVARLADEKEKAEAEELARIEKEAAEKAALEASEAEKVRREENSRDAEAVKLLCDEIIMFCHRKQPSLQRNAYAYSAIADSVEKARDTAIFTLIGE